MQERNPANNTDQWDKYSNVFPNPKSWQPFGNLWDNMANDPNCSFNNENVSYENSNQKNNANTQSSSSQTFGYPDTNKSNTSYNPTYGDSRDNKHRGNDIYEL